MGERLPEPRCVISPGFHRYRVEVSLVRYPCAGYERWQRETRRPKPHFEVRVVRGGSLNRGGRWMGGDQCAGPGWPSEDVFGGTPEEAVAKARRIAREWVRWQLSLARRSV